MYKYSQVVDSIRDEIQSGKRKPGDKLPSIKACATSYGYNSDTIVKAYQILEEEHLIYSTPKSGYYVVKSLISKEKKDGLIDMITVRPPDSINPYKDFYHCMEKSISIYKNKLMEYSQTQGMEELRAVLVKHLMNFQIFTKADDLFITTGAQQALYILATMPFPSCGGKVLVEQPTYAVMLQTLRCNNVPVVGIKRTVNGIDLQELEAIFQTDEIKFFYTMPRYQNPTGFCYSERDKKAILRLAAKYSVYIVEDDYLADLEIEGKANSLFSMDRSEHVIYIQSFSKTLLPGLRLGVAIVPKSLQENFHMFKQNIDLNTPVLNQGALEIYLKSSMYPSHVVRTKKFYQHKMEVLKTACEQWLPKEITYHVPSTGIYAYMELHNQSAHRLVQRLSKAGMLISDIFNCFIEGVERSEGIRLCVCNCEEEELQEVIKKIGEQVVCSRKRRINDFNIQ
jgi:DNA-binding transcriptional MocR family regulator